MRVREYATIRETFGVISYNNENIVFTFALHLSNYSYNEGHFLRKECSSRIRAYEIETEASPSSRVSEALDFLYTTILRRLKISKFFEIENVF